MILHIISYVLTFYKKYEIQKNGKPDLSGVLRTKRESFVSTIELLVTCILFGFIGNHFYDLTYK